MPKKRTRGFGKLIRYSGLYVREIVGWALMLIGLDIFRFCFQYLNNSAVIEGFIAAMIGFVLFRSGLQLVKVSVAARAVRAERLEMADSTSREYSSA